MASHVHRHYNHHRDPSWLPLISASTIRRQQTQATTLVALAAALIVLGVLILAAVVW